MGPADPSSGHGRLIGIYIDVSGELAPDGGYRMCRVERTRLGKIMLAPVDDECVMSAMIRTMTADELELVMQSFYVQQRQLDDESRTG